MNQIEQLWPGWEIVREIGQGSFGSVYEIRRDVYGRSESAALKVISIPQSMQEVNELRSEGYDDESITNHFQRYLEEIVREYGVMLDLKGHTNIVYCDDYRALPRQGTIGWDVFIKMELLIPLMNVIGKTYDEAQVIRMGIDLCNALILCKNQNIIHRDIKPQNIFVSKTGDYKLGDFGVAKIADKTVSGTKIGTFKYMAPEVYKNLPYGTSSDLYALGLVLYWAMNERRTPFLPLPPEIPTPSMDEEARRRRFSGEIIPAPAHGSKALQEIVLKACAYDPGDRFRSPTEMREALRKLESGLWIPEDEDEKTVGAFGIPVVPSAVPDEDKTTGAFSGKSDKPLNLPEEDEEKTMGAFGGSRTAKPPVEEDEDKTTGVFGIPVVPVTVPEEDKTTGAFSENPDKPLNLPEEDEEKTMGAFGGSRTAEPPVEEDEDKTTGVFGVHTTQEVPEEENEGTVGAAPVPAEPPVEEVPETPEEEVPETPAETPETPEQPETPLKKKSKKWLLIPGAVAAIIVIILLLLRSCDGQAQLPAGNVSGETVGEAAGNQSVTPEDGDDLPVQLNWSQWADQLPDYVTSRDYEIEEQTLYSTRKLETTSSTDSKKLDGWEYVSTVEAGGEFGPWSSWSDQKVTDSDTREVETKTYYRYREQKTTTGSSSTMSGWELYDTTYTYGDYGSWSSWSTTAATKSSTRQVETKTQYGYRDITVTQEYSDWSAWGDWQDTQEDTGDLVKEESRYVYYYYYVLCHLCKGHTMSDSKPCAECGKSGLLHSTFGMWSTTSYDELEFQSDDGTYDYTYINGEKWYVDWSVEPKYQYRYATRTLEDVTTYSDWSAYSDTKATASSTREVRTQTVYRYRDKEQIPTYHFRQWGSWSDWSANAVTASDIRQVETTPYYRYRDQVTETTHYFERWTDWSEYTEEAAEESEDTEVQTKVQYRYRSK